MGVVSTFMRTFSQLLALCESEDVQLSKLPCYRAVPSLIPLKVRIQYMGTSILLGRSFVHFGCPLLSMPLGWCVRKWPL